MKLGVMRARRLSLSKRLASAFSWLWCGIDPAGLAIQLVLMLGTLAVAGSAITYHGSPQWLASAGLIAASVLGGSVHAKWAASDAPLPAGVRSTFHVRTEWLTLALSALILEGAGSLAPTLAPELVRIAASARFAFGIAAAFVVIHALMTAPAWLADHEIAADLEPRIQIPRRPPRLRHRHSSVRWTHT